MRLGAIWRAVEGWVPHEESRVVVRHVIMFMVVVLGYWATSRVAARLIDHSGSFAPYVSGLDFIVLVGSLAVLGIRLIQHLWRVTGATSYVFITA